MEPMFIYEIPMLRFYEPMGKGSFGTVFKAFDLKNLRTVAIKRTLKNGGLVSREYKILRELSNCENCVQLIDIFYTLNQQNQCIQNLVFEFFPENLSSFIRYRYRLYRPLGLKEIQKIFCQILKGLHFIHDKQIMHRDLKPENILIDPERLAVKICDFGSAKKCNQNINTPFIVSRYYRAPELIFCNKDYDKMIDIWSAGCIFVELFTGLPLFPGRKEGEQFIKQAQVLGPPNVEELMRLIGDTKIKGSAILNALNIKRTQSLSEMFKNCSFPEVAYDLALRMLQYCPENRLSARDCLRHRFFSLD